jgi:nucleotide-binding universal stress UspA family protein
MLDTRLLVVVDESAASERAVKYVGKFVGKRRGFHICLVHILPPLPPRLLEHGGAEDPAKEARLSADLKSEQRRWTSDAKKKLQKVLDKARAILQKAGIPTGAMQALFCEPEEGPYAAESILNMAREYRSRTVVVGRRSVSWFHELFSQELSEELLRRGKGFCVWAVE